MKNSVYPIRKWLYFLLIFQETKRDTEIIILNSTSCNRHSNFWMQWIDVGEKFWWCQYWLFTSVHLFQIIQDILKWTLPKEKSIQNIFSEKFLQRKRTNWTWEYGNQNPFNKFLNRPEFSLFCFAQPLINSTNVKEKKYLLKILVSE